MLFLDSFTRLMNVVECLNETEHLQLVVHFDSFDDEQKKRIREALSSRRNDKVEIVHFDELLVREQLKNRTNFSKSNNF